MLFQRWLSMPSEPRPEDKLIEELAKRAPQLITSVGAMGVGVWLMIDDRKDLGKLVCNGCNAIPNFPHPHHNIWGILAFLGGVAGLGLTMLDLLIALNPVKLSEQDIKRLMEIPKRIKETTKPSPWNHVPIDVLEKLR
jgi:hypothetical protein